MTRDGQGIITVKPGTVVSSMMSNASNHSSKKGTFGGATRLPGSGADNARRMVKNSGHASRESGGSGSRKEKSEVF